MFTLYAIRELLGKDENGQRDWIARTIHDINILKSRGRKSNQLTSYNAFCIYSQSELGAMIFDAIKRNSNVREFVAQSDPKVRIQNGLIVGPVPGSKPITQLLNENVFDFLNELSELPVRRLLYARDEDTYVDISKDIDALRHAAGKYGANPQVSNAEIAYNVIDKQMSLIEVLPHIIDNSNHEEFPERMSRLISDALQSVIGTHYKMDLNGADMERSFLVELVKQGIWTLASMLITLNDLMKGRDSVIRKIVEIYKTSDTKLNKAEEYKWFCEHANIAYIQLDNDKVSNKSYFLKLYGKDERTCILLNEFDKAYNNFKARAITAEAPFLCYHNVVEQQYRHYITNMEETNILFMYPIFIYRILMNQEWIHETLQNNELIFNGNDIKDNGKTLICKDTFENMIDQAERFLNADQPLILNEFRDTHQMIPDVNLPIFKINDIKFAFYDGYVPIERYNDFTYEYETYLVKWDVILSEYLKERVNIEKLINDRNEFKHNRIGFEKRASVVNKKDVMDAPHIKIEKHEVNNDKLSALTEFYYKLDDDTVVHLINARSIRSYLIKNQTSANDIVVTLANGRTAYVTTEKLFDVSNLLRHLINNRKLTNHELNTFMYVASYYNMYNNFKRDYNELGDLMKTLFDDVLKNKRISLISNLFRKLANLYSLSIDHQVNDIGNKTFKPLIDPIMKLAKYIQTPPNDMDTFVKSVLETETDIAQLIANRGQGCTATEMIHESQTNRDMYINSVVMTNNINNAIVANYPQILINQINNNQDNIDWENGKVNSMYQPQSIPFGRDIALNKAYNMLNEVAEITPYRGTDGLIHAAERRLLDGRLFMDIEDIPADGVHEWNDSKFYLAQLISVLSYIHAGKSDKKRMEFTKHMLEGFVITNNTASTHGFSYHFYFPLRVVYRDVIKVLNSTFASYMRNMKDGDNVFRYVDPLVYLDDIVNIRLMYYNKGGSLFAPRRGTRVETSGKWISDADRLIIGDDGRLKENIRAFMRDIKTLCKDDDNATLGELMPVINDLKQGARTIDVDEEDEEVLIKMIKKSLIEPVYTMLAQSFKLFEPNEGNRVLVSSGGKNYHSFYKVGAWAIQNADNDIRKLVQQTSINNLKDVKNNDLVSFIDEGVGDKIMEIDKVEDKLKDLYAPSKLADLYALLIEPFLGSKNAWTTAAKTNYDRELRKLIDALYS